MENKKEKFIAVWDVNFCYMDKDGNPERDEDGNVIKYEAPNLESGLIADMVNEEDLYQI
jgi:hypothetical protein